MCSYASIFSEFLISFSRRFLPNCRSFKVFYFFFNFSLRIYWKIFHSWLYVSANNASKCLLYLRFSSAFGYSSEFYCVVPSWNVRFPVTTSKSVENEWARFWWLRWWDQNFKNLQENGNAVMLNLGSGHASKWYNSQGFRILIAVYFVNPGYA